MRTVFEITVLSAAPSVWLSHQVNTPEFALDFELDGRFHGESGA